MKKEPQMRAVNIFEPDYKKLLIEATTRLNLLNTRMQDLLEENKKLQCVIRNQEQVIEEKKEKPLP